jgi:hypothetical protein
MVLKDLLHGSGMLQASLLHGNQHVPYSCAGRDHSKVDGQKILSFRADNVKLETSFCL